MVSRNEKELLNSEKELRKIGGRLKELRKAKGYTNPDKFAYDHDLNRSQYGKYEAGRTNITIGTLITLLNCHNITLEQFFDEEYGKL
ncbi:MAG TPA: helix-turn-helix transcriptional regulator [Pedobacter sp.]|uniref:helix-turn-helix domain-containing protein n=1 Tax=Pedobacter sp. TaxID=1411316 RepID=UPI002C8B9F7C|nr:helix-turn-helix transcriptional regulator [Pedobacter sp.]HMI01415.1 helix-turn-helix transcriptional regulator [Pedobacter sp.]